MDQLTETEIDFIYNKMFSDKETPFELVRPIMQKIIINKDIVQKLNREKELWEEPMDSSFSNEIRRSVLRTLTDILNIPKQQEGNA